MINHVEQRNSLRNTGSSPVQSLLLEYRPQVNMDMVERLLGKRNRQRLTRTTRNRVDKYYQPVLGLLKPRVTWRSLKLASFDSQEIELEDGTLLQSGKMAKTFAGAHMAVCFVATVGPEIDAMIETFVERGKVADAYVIDAMASGAIEHTASSFQEDYVDDINSTDYVAGLRFSPGYCDWSISEQHKLFSLVDGETIGVSLSDSALMSPRKTVSAVFGLYDRETAEKQRALNPCRQCGKIDCIARRAQQAPHPLH